MSLARKLLMGGGGKSSSTPLNIIYSAFDATTKAVTTSWGGYSDHVTDPVTLDRWIAQSSGQTGKYVVDGNFGSSKFTGSRSSDYMYVTAGSSVLAYNFGFGHDYIYLTGSWSSYTKTVYQGMLTFTRVVNGLNESVTVYSRQDLNSDFVVFRDGMANVFDAAAAISVDPNCSIDSITGYDPLTTTPAAPDSTFAVIKSQIPSNRLLANGQLVSRKNYPYTYRMVGTKYGAGDGLTTFKLPTYEIINGVVPFIATTESGLVSSVGDISYSAVDMGKKSFVTSSGTFDLYGSTGGVNLNPTIYVKSGNVKIAISGNIVVYGSQNIDSFYVTKGSIADLRTLAGGVDVIYFPSTFESYTKSNASNGLSASFTRLVDGLFECIYVATSGTSITTDTLIFTNGSINSFDAYNAIAVNPNCTLDSIAGHDPLTTTPATPDPSYAQINSPIPVNKLLANGQLVSRASYPYLFAQIGINYGAGDGLATFQLPTVPDSADGKKAFIAIC